jgi:uncharacterized coiled-coil DUF342 family protein
MTEENTAVAEQQPVINGNTDTAAVPQQKVKKPTRPDDASQKEKIEELQEIITKNKKRSEEIKQMLEDRRNGRSGGSAELQQARAKLNETREKFKELVKQKQILRQQLESATKTREAARVAVRDLKSLLKFKSEEEIEKEIIRLEDEIQHNSLSLIEEKKVLEDIRKLKNSKATVSEYSDKMQALSEDETACSELNSAIKAIDVEITNIRKEEDEYRAAMNAEKKKEEALGLDNQTLWKEKEECRENCKEAYEKIKDLRAAHDVEWQEFKAQDKLWRAQVAAEKARRREEYLKEKAARDAEREARAKEMAPDPYHEEIATCEQLASYLSKFAENSSGAKEESNKPASEGPAALDGMKVLKKEEGVDPDAWMRGTGGKKKGKGKKNSAPKSAASDKLVHSVDILSAFASLKISVPLTTKEVPFALKEVSSCKEAFLQKRKDAEDGTEGASAEQDEPESSSKPKEQKKRAGSEKVALKLDDESSWPTMGGAPQSSAVEVIPSDDDAEELEEGEIPQVSNKSGDVAVSLKVNSDQISMAITHN